MNLKNRVDDGLGLDLSAFSLGQGLVKMAKSDLLALLVCIASGIGLAACSGGGGGTAPSTPAPAEPDPEVGSDFSSARSAMIALREEIAAIESSAQSATTDAQKIAVRSRAANARTRYAAAVGALETALDAMEAGSDDYAAAAAYVAGIRVRRQADLDRLTAAENAVADRWAAIEGPSVAGNTNPAPSAGFERFKRAEDDGSVIPDADRLSVQTEAVMHSAGKYVISPDRAGPADELPARSITLRTAGTQPRNWKIQGADGTPDATGATDGVLNYSVQITPGGLVYKMAGNAIYYDFQRRFDVGDNINDWFGRGPDGESGTSDDGAWSKGLDTPVNWIHDDIRLTFGPPPPRRRTAGTPSTGIRASPFPTEQRRERPTSETIWPATRLYGPTTT